MKSFLLATAFAATSLAVSLAPKPTLAQSTFNEAAEAAFEAALP